MNVVFTPVVQVEKSMGGITQTRKDANMRTLICALIALAPAQSALAKDCYKIKFFNDSEASVEAVWRAGICFGIYNGYNHVCKHVKIKSGKSDYYYVKWGEATPVVQVKIDYSSGGKSAYYDRYIYMKKKHGFREDYKYNHTEGTPPNCKKDYSIRFTQADLEEVVAAKAYHPREYKN